VNYLKVCSMSFNHTLSAVMKGRWMLQREWAEAHLPLVLSLLQGNPVSFVDRTGNELVELPFAIDPETMKRYELYGYNRDTGRYGPNANIPPGSVGVVPISGPITKYNGECGEPGSITRSNQLAEMERRENISAVVLLLDTPGGEARAANGLTTTIEKMKKPVLSFVDGMAASLGMWITAASDEVYLSSKMDEVGSIGSYVMLADWAGYFEKQGLNIHEIYAPQSEDKNKDYREALKGNYGLVKADLAVHVDAFIDYVKTGRPKSAAHVKEWNSGKMFYAADAIKFGLADGVRSFEQVIGKAAWNAKMKKKKSY
jgi:protease IV